MLAAENLTIARGAGHVVRDLTAQLAPGAIWTSQKVNAARIAAANPISTARRAALKP